jgi:hypothetical protein
MVGLGAALLEAAFSAQADNGLSETAHQVRHVLLISVDGLHALDLSNYVATHPGSTVTI